jgi:hypothetical protein|tara:strand:+ start:636 stop:995 length:360 start_codon:yes stop_codon:yes gene_type:complete
MYFLYQSIYLDTHLKTYIPVISIEPRPESNSKLYNMTTTIRMPKLSEFKQLGPGEDYKPCLCVLKSLKENGRVMSVNELPHLLSYLYSKNCKIEKDVTKIVGKTNIMMENQKLIAAIVE